MFIWIFNIFYKIEYLAGVLHLNYKRSFDCFGGQEIEFYYRFRKLYFILINLLTHYITAFQIYSIPTSQCCLCSALYQRILFITAISQHSSWYKFFIQLSIDGDTELIFNAKIIFIIRRVSHRYFIFLHSFLSAPPPNRSNYEKTVCIKK